jgi:signal transduction histidine kinase
MRIALKESLDGIRSGNEVLERRVSERTAELQELTHELKARDETRLRLLRKVIAAQEDERKRIARELHDETCQTVTALAVRIETALSASTNAEARERLGDVGALARTTLDDLHRLIFDLRPSILDDLGLFPAIRWFAERNLTSKGISVRYEFDVPDDRLPPEYETSLFRAVQESLNNVVRHARAETVLLQAAIAADQLTIEIEDDGEGFDPDEVVIADESGRGLGILGIRERIELLRGTAVLESALGRGTHVTISVPLPKGGAYGQDHGSDS